MRIVGTESKQSSRGTHDRLCVHGINVYTTSTELSLSFGVIYYGWRTANTSSTQLGPARIRPAPFLPLFPFSTFLSMFQRDEDACSEANIQLQPLRFRFYLLS
jgi:hypothetical protein